MGRSIESPRHPKEFNQFNVLCNFRDKDGDRNPRRLEGGERERDPISNAIHCHHQNGFHIKKGSCCEAFNCLMFD